MASWEEFRIYENFCNDSSVKLEVLDDCRSLTRANVTVPEYARYLCSSVRCTGTTTEFWYPPAFFDPDDVEPPFLFDSDFFAPPSYYSPNTSKLLFSNCSLNLFCLLFLALTLISKPTTRHNVFADAIYIAFVLFSHSCLLYNVSFSLNEFGRFKLDTYFFWVFFSLISYIIVFIVAKRSRKYLGLHTPNEINVHYQRTIQVSL